MFLGTLFALAAGLSGAVDQTAIIVTAGLAEVAAGSIAMGLGGYLAAVAAVVGSGVWSAVWTWKHRTGRAHALSILLIVWGLVLAAIEVLPRIGYAKETRLWSCTIPASPTIK